MSSSFHRKTFCEYTMLIHNSALPTYSCLAHGSQKWTSIILKDKTLTDIYSDMLVSTLFWAKTIQTFRHCNPSQTIIFLKSFRNEQLCIEEFFNIFYEFYTVFQDQTSFKELVAEKRDFYLKGDLCWVFKQFRV